MPKILINEVDKTSAGTPGRYGNYAVLLAGFKGTPDKDESKHQKPDENGVYEFSSAQAFKDTIGRDDEAKTKHYGNKMAYELLNLGYQVIYVVIDDVQDMADENFWAIFKDKASYDFRFISHGLLASDTDKAYYAKYDDAMRLAEAITLLEEAEKAAGVIGGSDKDENGNFTKVFTLDELIACDDALAQLLADRKITNFGSSSGNNGYTLYHVAAGFGYTSEEEFENMTDEEKRKACTKQVDKGIYNNYTQAKSAVELLDKEKITLGVFNTINGNIARLASYRAKEDDGTILCDGRGDCVALIELDENAYGDESYLISDNAKRYRPEELIIYGIKGMSSSIGEEGAYCALTVPSVHYYVDGKNTNKMPAAFHYLACFMNSLGSGFAEWYAAAGYNRGVSSYVIDHTSVKLGEIAINALEPRNIENQETQPPFACNVIANFRGSYYLWGNRTAALLGEKGGGGDLTAEHFLNIRQLCSTIKKQLYVACRRFTFDPNSDTLWFNFVNAITPTLDAMKADQGIRDYKVVKVFTDKKATLKAKVRIIPIEAVEDFDILVSLEDSFGGISVTAE
jgi:hypothetical protein